ncbi:MAG: hypothetical protein E4G91_03530 [Candidatus Zixiibacteriota bacterium]|nr:MAG: hypothetical protein E4G91_03530 [candidate division Zixibacteria bacterium]
MRPKLIVQITLAMLMAFPLLLSCGQKQAENQNSAAGGNQQAAATSGSTQQATAEAPKIAATKAAAAGFAGIEKQLIDTLLVMWSAKGHLTSIDQAAEILGITVSDSLRADMLKKLNDNLTMSEKLSRYRPATFVLTNREKLIAQYIIRNEKKNLEFPSIKQIAADLKIAEPELKSRLKFLVDIGLLYDLGGSDATNKLGYSFGGNLADFTFDMGLRYHAFFVDDKLPFNVGCAKEALYLFSTEFAKNKVRYETTDPLTLAPVVVLFDQGQVESIAPQEAKLVEGGACGHNNLFVSQQNAENWTSTQPRLAQQQIPPVYDIRERLAQIAEQSKQQSSDGE